MKTILLVLSISASMITLDSHVALDKDVNLASPRYSFLDTFALQ